MIAAFDLLPGRPPGEYQPAPGDTCEVRLAGVHAAPGEERWWRVMFAGAELGTIFLAPLEPEMPHGTVVGDSADRGGELMPIAPAPVPPTARPAALRRYSVPCHACDGSGFTFEDDDGNKVLETCRCYRGRVTVALTPDDERRLLVEIQKNQGNPAVPT